MILGTPAAERFFGSLAAFARQLAQFLQRPRSLADLFVYDSLWRFLRYRDDAFVEDMAALPAEAALLAESLAGVCRNRALDTTLRTESLALLGKLPGGLPRVRALLGTDLDHAAKLALGLVSG